MRGRLTVSFHSGMGIRRFYNELMANPAEARQLDNGLKVIVQEEHTAPLASVWCWYKVGSKDERPGLTGVSHWVEHMNFKGTTNIPRDQVKGIIEQFGGSWNGYTFIDQTTYLETATRDALDRMLFIESERMANCLYHPDDCESERTVIISELQGGENDPDQLLDQELTATAFKAHPYRHPTIGWMSDLESMSRDDLYGYYRRHYVPNNATLVVVGDVDTDDALRRVEHHFGKIRSRRDRASAAHRRARADRRAPTDDSPRRNDGVLEGRLSRAVGHRSGILPAARARRGSDGRQGSQSLVELPGRRRRSAAHGCTVPSWSAAWRRQSSGSLLPTEQPFLYTVSVTATEGTPLAAVESALLEALERVRREGITDAELTRAKAQLRARLVFESDSVTNIAHQLGYFDTIASVGLFHVAARSHRRGDGR